MTRERLLCIKLAARGDLLLAAPAFRWLRESRPDAELTLLVGRSCQDVAEHLPFFDRIVPVDDRAIFAGGAGERLRAAAQLLRLLRRGEFAEALVFHRDWRYAALALLAGIPVRRGLARGGGDFLLTDAFRAEEDTHHVAQYLGLAGAEAREQPLRGSWRFGPGEAMELLRAAEREGLDPTRRPRVALGFGGGNNVKTRTALKQWPLERFQELAADLAGRGVEVLWLGDRTDEELLGDPPVGLSLAGRLSVPQTAAVLSTCGLTIANDTFLLHLSEALGVPSIGIFGPTHPGEYRPLGPRSAHFWAGDELPCSPCHRDGFFPVCRFGHRCMTGTEAARVAERAMAILRAADAEPGARTAQMEGDPRCRA